MKNFLRLIKKILPSFLPIPYFHKSKLRFFFLPKHHWTQYIQNCYEPETFKIIKKIFNKYQIKCFWDIGANVGMYSVYIAKKYRCKIYAFEPSKKYYKFLKYNLSPFLNAYSNNFGIGGKKKQMNLILTEEPGSNYIAESNTKNKEDNSEICEMKTIRNLSNYEIPDLVKIDVEGYEYEILYNSIDFFKVHKTILILEIDENHLKRYSKNQTEIINLLKSKDYSLNRIENSNNYICLIKSNF